MVPAKKGGETKGHSAINEVVAQEYTIINKCIHGVSTEEGLSLAREYNCAFFETSAALRFCIDDAFHGLVREIRKKESAPSLMEKKLKRKDSLWKKLKGSLKKKRENMT
ncbi:GTP-binding protein Rit2 [Tupaia chinensis]|uniref:GTP-binding protein Rit2 n=1 Tax=Tupaia chinensis TaxID=246437 RepID=L9L333_TUPCH|nr:GTP-binding protein Rit2 [Tupaia chinensis]